MFLEREREREERVREREREREREIDDFEARHDKAELLQVI